MKKIFIYGNSQILNNYQIAVQSSGAKPCFGESIDEAVNCDALLLAGGGDMDPALYGEKNIASYQIDNRRDNIELQLVDFFLKKQRPVLGICRGMQVINVSFGGTLEQEVKNTKRHIYEEKTGDKIHPIFCVKNSFLERLYGSSFVVNSAHHQACKIAGKDLRFTAFSEDNVAEALEDVTKRVYAVQFHPERMAYKYRRSDTVDGRFLWEFFIQQI